MIKYKYKENELINELQEYINKTYSEHYSTGDIQPIDVIIDSGYGTGFCMGNITKYLNRYGHKGDPSEHRKDLMKILHYTLLQLYVHDKKTDSTLIKN